VVTGFLLLIAFGPQAAIGPRPGRDRRAAGLPLDRCGTGGGGDGLPADGARDPPVARQRPTAGWRRPRGTLGASPVWVFLTVTLPLSLPGIVVGAILAFAKAMGEFGATITFVSNIPGETRTMPSAIYAFLQVPGGDDAAWRLVIVSVVIAMGALIVSEVISRRVDVTGRGTLMLSVELSAPLRGISRSTCRLRGAGRASPSSSASSGSGKTSVIKSVAGLFHPEGGRVASDENVLFDRAAGYFVPPHRRRMGYVFQEARLFPHLNVRRNLTYGRRFAPPR
jgi:molybdate transport system permease protein